MHISNNAALSDGSRCAFAGTGATIAINGKRANFTYERHGENDVVSLSDIKMGDRGWEIVKAVIGKTDKGFAAKSSETMLIKAIGVEPSVKL